MKIEQLIESVLSLTEKDIRNLAQVRQLAQEIKDDAIRMNQAKMNLENLMSNLRFERLEENVNLN